MLIMMSFKIKNTASLIESASIYLITLILVKFFLNGGISQTISELIVPGLFLYIPILILIISRRNPEDYGFTLSGWLMDTVYVIIFMLIFFPPAGLIYFVYRKIFLPVSFNLVFPDGIIYFAFTQILVVGLSEEAFFRGYLQKRLSEGLEGRCLKIFKIEISWALLIANILFTITHIIVLGQIWRINVFLPGLAFGWLREKRKSLTAPVLFHGLSNVFMKVLESSFR